MLVIFLWAAPVLAASDLRPVVYGDVHPGLRALLAAEGIEEAAFPEWLVRAGRSAKLRMEEGERDHLIYYLLQSAAFSTRPRVEPALSAREFSESGRIPDVVAARMADFLANPRGGRHAYLLTLLPPDGGKEFLEREYRRAMRFLHQKEFESRRWEGNERRDFVASLYQTRGHSTDTKPEANFAVHTGLEVLRKLEAELAIERVLIIGPGQDFAPRTQLRDQGEAQSYQPYAVADSLLALGFSPGSVPRIDCADINPRVVDFINSFGRRLPPRLFVRWGKAGPDYEQYFQDLGKAAGTVRVIRPGEKEFTVRSDAAKSVTARLWNVLTELPRSSVQYDLVIATNVLLYFSRQELLLAMNNVRRLLRPGGYFLHNETRGEVEAFGVAAGMRPVQARRIRLAGAANQEVYDTFVLHKKRGE